MATKLIYPAVFHPESDGGYSVDFPDLLGCVTEGDSLSEAVDMAEDALGIYLYSLRKIKSPIQNRLIQQTSRRKVVILCLWSSMTKWLI